MKAEDVKIDLKELKEFKRKNAEERLWFIYFWVNYIKTHQKDEIKKEADLK